MNSPTDSQAPLRLNLRACLAGVPCSHMYSSMCVGRALYNAEPDQTRYELASLCRGKGRTISVPRHQGGVGLALLRLLPLAVALAGLLIWGAWG